MHVAILTSASLYLYCNHNYAFPMQANKRYPHQLLLPSNYECILEEDGGILLASKCVATLQVGICSYMLYL